MLKPPLLLAALLAPLALIVPAAAQTTPGGLSGPYVSLGLGANFLTGETLHLGAPASISPHYGFDPGPAGFLSLGYRFGSGLRLEIEGDYASSHAGSAGADGQTVRAGGYEQQYGGFINALQDFGHPFALPVTPYLGIGAGYQEIQLDSLSAGGQNAPPLDSGPTQAEGSFAYQGIAGISAPLGVPGLDVTAEYRMIGTVNASGFNRVAEDAPTSGTVRGTFTHELLIGLRLLFGAAPPPPAPAPMAMPAAVPAPAEARTYLVFFDWNRADLNDRARGIIADAAKASARIEVTRIEVDGYTDLSGGAAYNQALSLRRADAVAEELVRDGVGRDQIAITGRGATHPLVPTAPGVREPQNRRVEIILR